MILDLFGRRVEEMVDRLTRDRPDGSKLSVEQILSNAYNEKDTEVLSIKIMDRLHNIKTMQAKTPEKIKKLIDETLIDFIPLATYLQSHEIKQEIIRLCYKYLGIEQSHYQYYQFQISLLDDYLLPSPTFQNVIPQMRNQCLLEEG